MFRVRLNRKVRENPPSKNLGEFLERCSVHQQLELSRWQQAEKIPVKGR